MSGVDETVEKLKRMVVTGEVRPGDRLPTERELAARFGMSRSSIREAVRALTTMNVLESRVGSGTFVTALRPDELFGGTALAVDLIRSGHVLELLEVRRSLDSLAASRAASRITAEELAQLRQLIDVMDSNRDLDERISADVEFHRVIAKASGNSVLAALVDSVSGDTLAARKWRGATDSTAAERMHSEHQLILDGLERADAGLASIAAAAHVAGAESWLRSLDSDQLPAADTAAAS